MCRWGCMATDTTFMCRWCGTRYCSECLRGDFMGDKMKSEHQCAQCKQKRCQGKLVEYFPTSDEKQQKKSSRNGAYKRGQNREVTQSANTRRAQSSKQFNRQKTKKKT